jgi:uroporphyrinogen-III synthase
VLPEALTAAGATVTIAEAYQTVVPEASAKSIAALLAGNPPDAISFTSASTAHNLAALLQRVAVRVPEGVVLASIGPITSKAMRELDIEPTVEARDATIPALVEAIVNTFES